MDKIKGNYRYFGPAPEGLKARLVIEGKERLCAIITLIYNIDDDEFDGLMFIDGEMYPAKTDENFRGFTFKEEEKEERAAVIDPTRHHFPPGYPR